MATIQTASGSNYRLGTPDVVASATDKNNSSRSNNNRLSADRLGISRGNVRATRPIKVRATVPLLSTLSGSGNVGPNNRNKKNDFLTVRWFSPIFVELNNFFTKKTVNRKSKNMCIRIIHRNAIIICLA
jgi:hypothetical protein